MHPGRKKTKKKIKKKKVTNDFHHMHVCVCVVCLLLLFKRECTVFPQFVQSLGFVVAVVVVVLDLSYTSLSCLKTEAFITT